MNTNLAPALSGAALALSLVALLSASPAPQSTGTQLAFNAGTLDVRLVGQFDPREAVVIEHATPFVVPAGASLVVTALGLHSGGDLNAVNLLFDGAIQVQKAVDQGVSGGVSMKPVPPGLVAPPGTTLFLNGATSGRAWGYLVRE